MSLLSITKTLETPEDIILEQPKEVINGEE